MEKKYKLLKDLPDVKAGSPVYWDKYAMEYYVTTEKESRIYFQEISIANPEWFSPLIEEEKVGDEKIEVELYQDYWDGVMMHSSDKGRFYKYQLCVYNELSEEQLPEIKNLLERYLRGEMNNPNHSPSLGEKEPNWYTKDEMYAWLRHENYSHEISEQLSGMWADDLQGSFKKGWEKGRNDGKSGTFDYKYMPESEKSKQPEKEDKPVLFTTEDGVKMYEGDSWFSVWDTGGGIDKIWENVKEVGKTFVGKRFSTKEKAKEYIFRRNNKLKSPTKQEIVNAIENLF